MLVILSHYNLVLDHLDPSTALPPQSHFHSALSSSDMLSRSQRGERVGNMERESGPRGKNNYKNYSPIHTSNRAMPFKHLCGPSIVGCAFPPSFNSD